MKPLLSTLRSETIETLIALCEELSYQEVAEHARADLGLDISPSSLCRLYTGHKIAEDQQTRVEYAEGAGIDPTQLLTLAESQLELRLLELTGRPNPGAAGLRALFQIVTRLQSLALSQRRVLVTEQREARMKQAEETKAKRAEDDRPFTQEEYNKGLEAMFGPRPSSKKSESVLGPSHL